MKKYYSTQRPIAPGTFPRQTGKEIVTNFDDKRFVDEIGKEAWGFVEYEEPLTQSQVSDYELIPSPDAPCTESSTAKKTLYFEGAGFSKADISRATVGNCRIRTAFHLDDGRAVYLEIIGSERTKHSSPKYYPFRYTGFVDCCYYITDEKPNDDCNRHRIYSRDARPFEYTEAAILRFVNSLGASFEAIKVVPDLGGYGVFPEESSCQGVNGYYYGDEFQFDEELTARREQVYQYYYDLEKAEGNKYPNFSLWVDEADPGLLHLLRHFPGTFKTAHNKHWIIRVDDGETIGDWIASAEEKQLGIYGC